MSGSQVARGVLQILIWPFVTVFSYASKYVDVLILSQPPAVRNRRLFGVGLIAVLLLLLRWGGTESEVESNKGPELLSSFLRDPPYPELQHSDACINAQLGAYERASPGTHIEANMPKIFGNRDLLIDGTSGIVRRASADEGFVIPMVELSPDTYDKDKSMWLVDVKTSVMKRLTRVGAKNSARPSTCLLVEELLFASAASPPDTTMIVHDITIINSQGVDAEVHFSQISSSGHPSRGPTPIVNTTAANVPMLTIPRPDDGTDLLLYSPTLKTATVPKGKTFHQVLKIWVIPPSSHFSIGDQNATANGIIYTHLSRNTKAKLRAATSLFEKEGDLLKEHLHIVHRAPRGVSLRILGMEKLRQSVAMGEYMLSIVNPSVFGKIVDPVSTCYHSAVIRDLSKWHIPVTADKVFGFAHDLAMLLHENGCRLCKVDSNTVAVPQLQTALTQAIAGLRSEDNHLRVMPSWDLPSGAAIRIENFPLKEHLLDIRLSSENVVIMRHADNSPDKILVSSGEAEPVRLKPSEPLSFPAGALYISDHHQGVANSREKDDAGHHPVKPKQRWPAWLIIFLIIIVIVFHFILFRLIFAEYCTGPSSLLRQ